MKIAVVAAPRTRSTLLIRYIHSLHKHLRFYNEYYTYAIDAGRHDLSNLADKLALDNNHIIKIMSSNLLPEYHPSVFKLNEYDQIHLIERYDFFDLCCSMQICMNTNIWHIDNNAQHNKIQQQQFTVTDGTIRYQAKNIANYISIKKYLLDNGVDFTLHNYDNVKDLSTKPYSNLTYEPIITNYHLKDRINNLFNEQFSYSELRSDLDSFLTGVGEEDRTPDMRYHKPPLYH